MMDFEELLMLDYMERELSKSEESKEQPIELQSLDISEDDEE